MAYDIPGDLCIFLALVFNLLAGISYLLVAWGKKSYENLARRSYHYFTLFAALIFAYLYYLIFSHNFQVQYVYGYSDRALEFFYLLSSFWAGQEGTYVMWLMFSALYGYVIIKKGGRYRNYGMAVYSLVNSFFLFLMIKLSPFALSDFVPADGAGLNPLLQDPWMVVHPPIIFVGYAAAGIPFAIAMAALITNDYSEWNKKTFPWIAVTSLFLAAGNILGGYWAYKTLGWGGFWAWDPVENSSFIPWFISLALIHGMIIERRSGALRKTNLMMTAFTFVLVIYGTFLTRSGVLSDFSVHSFVDLGINIYLVGFLVLYVFMSILFFLIRVASIGHQPLDYNYYGREFSLFIAMVLLFIFSIIVLFWTSLPILTSVFTDQPRAADIATYNDFALPFAILFALFLTAAPFLNFYKFTPRDWKYKIAITALVSAVVGFGLFYFLLDTSMVFAGVFTITIIGIAAYVLKSDLHRSIILPLVTFVVVLIVAILLGVKDYLYLLYFASAGMFIVSNLIVFFGYFPGRMIKSGGQLAHFGFGIMLIGILGSAAYTDEERLVLPRGETDEVFGVNISYQGMENEVNFPKNKLLLSYDDGSGIKEARPQLYFSKRNDGLMRKPFILKTFLKDVYFSPEQVQAIPGSKGLVLTEGEGVNVGDYRFTFEGYEISDHTSTNNMAVTARISVESESELIVAEPSRAMQESEDGQMGYMNFPATFGENDEYSITIDQILADKHAIVIDIPGLIEKGPEDQLIMSVSKKPIIMLVWIGTTLIMLGLAIVNIRRYREQYT